MLKRTLIVLVVALIGSAAIAQAQSPQIVSTHDASSTSYTCTEAGLNNAIAGSTPDATITFENGCTTLNLTSQVVVDRDLTIDGAGNVTLDGGDTTRVLFINQVTVTLRGLTIQNGFVPDTAASDDGGGIYNLGRLTIEASIIRNNSAAGSGGGISNNGIFTIIMGSTISNNVAGKDGGGINAAHGGGDLIVYDSRIVDNSTADLGAGGGIFVNSGFNDFSKIVNSVISGNSARDGGGLFCADDCLSIVNTLVTGNTATYAGGGLGFLNTSMTGEDFSNPPALVNSTVSGNYATTGGGIAVGSADIAIQNSIIYGNVSAPGNNEFAVVSGENTLRFSNSLYDASELGDISTNGSSSVNLSNPAQSPASLFVNYVAASANSPTTAGDFSLANDAIAINRGNDSFVVSETSFNFDFSGDGEIDDPIPDLAGNIRIQGLHVDIGAYETDILTIQPPYDFDNDGIVSPTDAIYVINRIGQTKNNDNAAADVDNNGQIEAADANAVIARIGQTTDAP